MSADDPTANATQNEPIAQAISRRTVELRLAYPAIRGVDVDLLFVAFLLETARFGAFAFGPLTIDVGVVEERYVSSLGHQATAEPHRFRGSAHAFFQRLGEEVQRSPTRRPNELHYLLAFMRTPEGLPARVFGELGTRPEDVEAYARNRTTASTSAPGPFLTPEEVAQRLSVNVQTVRAWIRSGKLPASRLAGRRVLRIREADIAAVLEPVDPSDFA